MGPEIIVYGIGVGIAAASFRLILKEKIRELRRICFKCGKKCFDKKHFREHQQREIKKVDKRLAEIRNVKLIRFKNAEGMKDSEE